MADRTVLVRVRANVSDFNRGIMSATTTLRGFHDEIDKTNDRTAWLAQSILALTPAVTTFGAGAVPVISGLAAQMTVAVGAAGTMALAFNGVGDALGALNDYQLDPTEAHLKKLNETMGKIGPEGREFVEFLDSIGPQFSELANISRAGIFPGVTEGIEDFLTLMPQVRNIIGEIADGIGELAGDTGEGLTGSRWEEFFTYLETDARPILEEMGHTIGNFATGLVQMMVQFGPLTADFSAGLERMSASFADWSDGLSESEGFDEFIAYVQDAGPKALEFFGAFVMALVELVEAAAPIGSIMLPQLTNLLEVVGAFADTPLGPLTLGFLALTSAWGRLNAVAQITGSGALGRISKGLGDSAREAAKSTRQVSAAGAGWKDFGNVLYNATIPTSTLVKNVNSLDRATGKHAVSALKARSAVESWGNRAKAAARNVSPLAGQAALAGIAMSGLDSKLGLTNTTSLALAGSLAGPLGAAVGASAGFLLDMKSAGDGATEAIRGLDAVARSGNIAALADQIEAAKRELADIENLDFNAGDIFERASFQFRDTFGGPSMDDARRKIDETTEALEAQELAQKRLADVQRRDEGISRGLAARADAYTAAVDRYNAAVERQKTAVRESREAARETATSFFGIGESVNDAKVSLSDWIGELEKQADALRDFRINAEEAADRGLRKGLIDALRDAGPEGALRLDQLANATDTEIARANKAWKRGQDEIKRYVNETAKVPKKVSTKVVADALPAFASFRQVDQWMDRLDGKRATTYVDTVRTLTDSATGGKGAAAFGQYADGGTVPGPRYPYADKVHILAAPGEEIITNRNGEADRFRRDRAAGAIPHYADGGTVTMSRAYMTRSAAVMAGGGGADLDYDRLIGGLGQQISGVVEGAGEAFGRGAARESGRPWTERVRQSRAQGLGGRPA